MRLLVTGEGSELNQLPFDGERPANDPVRGDANLVAEPEARSAPGDDGVLDEQGEPPRRVDFGRLALVGFEGVERVTWTSGP